MSGQLIKRTDTGSYTEVPAPDVVDYVGETLTILAAGLFILLMVVRIIKGPQRRDRWAP